MKGRQFSSKRPDRRDVEFGTNPGRPTKPKDEFYFSEGMQSKAIADLPRSSIQIASDPYSGTIPGQTPYPIIARNNPIFGGNYKGKQNLTGAGVEWYATSTNSKYLKAWDIVYMVGLMNYRYLPIRSQDNIRGKGMTDSFISAISEGLSQTMSSIFYSQPALSYTIETTLPMGTHTPVSTNYYTDTSVALYAIGIYYQTFLQSIAGMFNAYNTLRSCASEMIKMAWEREVSTLNSLFGLLLDKSSFKAQWKDMAMVLLGEYFDADWMHQANMISSVVGRKTGSFLDPLVEMKLNHARPDTMIIYNTINTTDNPAIKIWNDATDAIINNFSDPLDGMSKNTNFWDIIADINELVSVCTVQEWARSGNVRIGGNNYTNVSTNAYFNAVAKRLEALNPIISKFKTQFVDFRSVLDVMRGVGINNWNKRVNLQLTENKELKIPYNKTLFDIVTMLFSGSNEIVWNDTTQRWGSCTLWDKYLGIPGFDDMSGGAPLSFSVKDLVGEGDGFELALKYVPILFSISTQGGEYTAKIVNRLGEVKQISSRVLSVEDQDNNIVLSRLNPISSFARPIKLPIIEETYNDVPSSSMSYLLLQNLFGYGAITRSSGTDDYIVDADFISWFNYEIYDVRNATIGYARSKSMFRTSTDDVELGFNW